MSLVCQSSSIIVHPSLPFDSGGLLFMSWSRYQKYSKRKKQFQFISAIGWEHQRHLQGRGNWITARFWNWALQRECDENHCRFLGPQFLRIRRPSDFVEIFAFENTNIKSKTEGVWTRSIARS